MISTNHIPETKVRLAQRQEESLREIVGTRTDWTRGHCPSNHLIAPVAEYNVLQGQKAVSAHL